MAVADLLDNGWADSGSARPASGEAESLTSLAKREGYLAHYAARRLPLAWLATGIVETILAGEQPGALSLGALTRHPLPLGWEEQRALVARAGLKPQ
jgi:hypothetical protein